MAANPHSRL